MICNELTDANEKTASLFDSVSWVRVYYYE